MLRVVALILVLASPAYAGEVEPKIPTKFGCYIAKALFKRYSAKGYTIDQMKDFLRSKGLSEERIAGAEKCLG